MSSLQSEIYRALRKYTDTIGRRPDFKAALIDMDGTLYDSMPGHAKAWKAMCDQYGITCEEDEFFALEGMTGRQIAGLLVKRQWGREPSREEAEDMYAVKSGYFNGYPRVGAMPGAASMLETFRREGLKRVLVTGSGQASLLDRLRRDFPGAFSPELSITSKDVGHGKPHPEPYLRAMDRAAAAPWQCIVVENAPLGVESGHAAGAFVVAVATGPIPIESLKAAGADLVFESMEDFADALEALLDIARGMVYTLDAERSIRSAIDDIDARRYIVVTDDNVLPIAAGIVPDILNKAEKVVAIPAGEENKTVRAVEMVWSAMSSARLMRRDAIVNIGGGMVTDLGAFCAATFKRGLGLVNVPTTVLGAVDAAIGGKNGLDFDGVKNLIGTFRIPDLTVVSPVWLKSLPATQLLSGYAEMLKHALLDSDPVHFHDILRSDMPSAYDCGGWLKTLRRSARIKYDIVAADPYEAGPRKALNLGHTAGHAYEALALDKGLAVPHGYAVAWGLVTALALSRLRMGLDSDTLYAVADFVKSNYGPFPFGCDDFDPLSDLMRNDKKNISSSLVSFTLLSSVGKPLVDREVDLDDIRAAFDITMDLL